MKAQPTAILALLMALTACGEQGAEPNAQGSTTPPYVRDADSPLLSETVSPVRIGELGPNFAACNARGATRERSGTDAVAVRAAPFESAERIDALDQASEFFICSRTHDQRWFGIVYDERGQASERCGVSGPVSQRRNYQGPCAAGWVSSSMVRLISGVPHQLAGPPTD